MKTIKLFIIAAVVGLGLGAGYSFYGNHNNTAVASSEEASSEKIDYMPTFSYEDLQGNMRDSNEWEGKIVVLNFWATWCPPCRKEIPDFIELQETHKDNVQFIGVAIDDKEAVADFADTLGINYPTLLGDMAAIGISKQLGNRFSGLPFTAIFDKNGKLVHQQIGEITHADLEKHFSKLL